MTLTPAHANDWPLASGDFWEISGVKSKDGGALAYANFLAEEWKTDQEFAKSKGWIKSYTVLSNNSWAPYRARCDETHDTWDGRAQVPMYGADLR